jgi:hypothetical protein
MSSKKAKKVTTTNWCDRRVYRTTHLNVVATLSIITTKYGSELASFRSASITNASAKEDKSSRSNIPLLNQHRICMLKWKPLNRFSVYYSIAFVMLYNSL